MPSQEQRGAKPAKQKNLDVVLLFNKANTFGLARDVEALTAALGGQGCTIRQADPLEPPSPADLAIHLEQPCHAWMPWATANALIVNPEWYVPAAWDALLPKFQRVVFKEPAVRQRFLEAGVVKEDQALVIPWATAAPPATAKPTYETGFVWFLGGSQNKLSYVQTLVAAWRPEFPTLKIYSVRPLELAAAADGTPVPANVSVVVKDLGQTERRGIAARYRGHVACSRAEAFGTTAAEAEWLGAFTILNDLDCYKADYKGQPGVAFLPAVLADVSGARYPMDAAGPATIQPALDEAVAAFLNLTGESAGAMSQARRAAAQARWERFLGRGRELIADLRAMLPALPPRPRHLPPILLPAECPPITVVTLLYNRRKFFDLACHSLMIQDYPKDKIEWIIVEDSDDPMEDASDRVMAVAERAQPVQVRYIPLKKKTPVAEKRNIACREATNDVILMMDDDDHYPETSFRRRVAWLAAHPWAPRCVAATTIACYDLVKGISAVNAPPVDIPVGQRVSEATLTFTKMFWEARPFESGVQVGEGEGFIAGRERDFLELPPQQIIVAFSHGKNVSSRRIPSGADVKPGCFWGFPKEFLQFIHGLAGVKVVE